jgi:hypothetical protein
VAGGQVEFEPTLKKAKQFAESMITNNTYREKFA